MVEYILIGVEVVMFMAAVVSLYFHKQLKGLHWLLFVYILSLALLNIVSHLAGILGYNLFMVPISGLVALVVFQQLYLTHLLTEDTLAFKALIWLLTTLVLGHFLWFTDVANPTEFSATTVVFSYLIIVLLGLRYYWLVLNKHQTLNMVLVRFNGVILVYFACSALFFITTNFLINEALHLVAPFWMVYGISTLLFYVYLTYQIWQHGRTQKTSLAG